MAAWSDAQVSAPVLAADRLRLLHANRDLLEDLLERGLKLNAADGKLDRAEECRRALVTLSGAIDRATEEPAVDADRVAELTDQLTDLARSGLAPTLVEVREQVAAGSPEAERLAHVEADAAADLTTVETNFLLDPRLANSPKLAASQARLREALAEVRPPTAK